MRSVLNAYLTERIAAFLIVCCWFWGNLLLASDAPEIQVGARISDEEMQVGESVRLDITVYGSRNAEMPADIKVKGLELEYIGKSLKVQMLNMQMRSSCTYTFSVRPLQLGHFTIPALQVRVNGKLFQTQALSLKVVDSSLRQRLRKGEPNLLQHPFQSTDAQLAFGRLSVSRKEAYVGEVLPVKVQYYFHPRLSVQSIESIPSIIGEGFIVQKMGSPKQNYQERDGVRYMTLSFYTSICPLRQGALRIPSTSLTYQVLAQSFPEMHQGITDTFFQRFFSAMPNISTVQRMEVQSDGITIQALPLPDKGRPASFHGAIGDFFLHAEVVSPKEPSPGDPVTLRATISGKGNFEQIRVLDLNAKQGWQVYSPLPRLKKVEEGYSEKVFEWILMPNERKYSTPEVVFSYFSPVLKKYITLRAASQAVQAEPAPRPIIPMPVAPPSFASTTEKEKWRVVRKFVSESFQPVTARPEFTIANGIITLALLAFFGIQFARNYSKKKEVALHRSLKACLATASSADASSEQFFSSSTEYLRLWAQLMSGKEMKEESAREIAHAIGLSDRELALVSEIFARHEELSYGLLKEVTLSTETRTTILKFLRSRNK